MMNCLQSRGRKATLQAERERVMQQFLCDPHFSSHLAAAALICHFGKTLH